MEDLDFEKTKKVVFRAIVTEVDVPAPKSSTVEITVSILDQNDNTPMFPPSGYTVTIKESEETTRRPVVKVSWTVFSDKSNVSRSGIIAFKSIFKNMLFVKMVLGLFGESNHECRLKIKTVM